jgi:hypothetical protein
MHPTRRFLKFFDVFLPGEISGFRTSISAKYQHLPTFMSQSPRQILGFTRLPALCPEGGQDCGFQFYAVRWCHRSCSAFSGSSVKVRQSLNCEPLASTLGFGRFPVGKTKEPKTLNVLELPPVPLLIPSVFQCP